MISYSLGILLALLVLKKRYSILHVHQLSRSALVPVHVAKLIGKGVLVKLASAGSYGDIARINRTRFGRKILRILQRRVDMFISLTEEIQKELIQIGASPSQIVLLPNGVDTMVYAPCRINERILLRKEFGWNSHKIVLFVGRLVEKKRVEFLLEAWRKIHAASSDSFLVVVGGGYLRPQLEQMVTTFQLSDSIKFIGRTERVVSYLQAADVFVLPSVSEGLSNALLEAMSTALPVIATRTPSNASVITDSHDGLLFEENSGDDLVDKITKLLNDDELMETLGMQARETVIESFSFRKIVSVYDHLYCTLACQERIYD